MKSWRSKGLLLAGAGSLILAIPAFSQEADAPESLLPPGFGDPESLPPPVEEPRSQPQPLLPPAPDEPTAAPERPDGGEEEGEEEEEEEVEPADLFVIPPAAQRSTDVVGVLRPGNWGLERDAFGGAHGAFLASLMRQIDAPIASRWVSILLRRALLSRVAAPPAIDPVNWVAERSWLLLRMGEADAARMLVQGVDTNNYTPRMIQVAVQTSLATADIAGLCPLVEPGREISDEPVWPLSEAMCAALEGEAARAGALIDQARRRGVASGIDLTLAEKVVGAGAETRRAVSVQWDDVNSVSAWRFGLSAATGLPIPDRLMANAAPQVHAWLARAPMIPLEQRLNASAWAASLGVFSSSSLVDIYSLLLDMTDPGEQAGTVGARLRTAFVAADPAARMEAIRSLWNEAETPHEAHARSILTAAAAAGIPPSENFAGDAAPLIAAMLSAGMDKQAARWAGVIEDDRAWALLAAGAPEGTVEIDADRVESFAGEAGRREGQMLLAALAGLGRLDSEAALGLSQSLGVNLGRENVWTRMLDQAARRGQPGTVALLAGIGLQARDWGSVPPMHLYRIVRALREVGHEYEARMIAAEALARL